LHQLFQLLAQNGVKKEVKIEDIGLTPEDEPKVFLGLNFTLLEESERKNLATDYQLILEKLLESNFNYRDTMQAQSDNTHISDYSQRLDKKLNEM
jgi:ribosome recycling factor